MSQNRYFKAGGLRFSINPDGKSVTLSELIDRNAKEVVIPSTVNNYPVTSIGDRAFHGCTGLTNVIIPDSVKEIGSGAFSGCSNLASVTIPDSVTSIGSYAFFRCSGLTNVIIPDSVTSIGRYAFRHCTGLTSVTIPDSVTAIGDGAFSGCTCLTSVTIPDSVKAIGDSAFSGCSGLKSVTIPNSVTTIGDGAFYGCSNLTSVTIPDSVTKIGEGAFNHCTGLKNVTIPDSVTTICRNAFSGCSGLTSVIIPDSVTAIGDCAFDGCTGLTSVTIGNSVTSIGYRAFEGCYRLLSVTIPDTVTEIGYFAFSDCFGPKQIILTGFGHNCKVLPKEIQNRIEILRIGSGISEIGDICCNPKEIWCYAEVPPKCSEGVFTGFDAVLHVPQRAAAAYFTADVWRNFTNIVFDADEKLTLCHPSVNMGLQYFLLGKTVVSGLLETFQLSATAEHTRQTGVVWSSSDPSIATVSEQGVVRAILPGTCRISATLADCSAVYASCEVKVDNRVIISLDSDTIQMRAMKIHALVPKFYPRVVDVTVTSSDPGVVLPREDGQRVQLLGLKAGECRVTLSAPDARPVTVTVVVTVTDVVSRE